MSAMDRLRRVSPLYWFGGALAVGVIYLTWHTYACDPDDDRWLDPGQPPDQVTPDRLPVPGMHGCGRQMECGDGMRGRAYPDSLSADARFSLVVD